MSGETKQRISELEAEIAIARQRITDLANENRHLQECHPNIRDQFAMAALTGLLSDTDRDISYETAAYRAFEIADYMMEARDEED